MSSHSSYPRHSGAQKFMSDLFLREARDRIKFYHKHNDKLAGIEVFIDQFHTSFQLAYLTV